MTKKSQVFVVDFLSFSRGPKQVLLLTQNFDYRGGDYNTGHFLDRVVLLRSNPRFCPRGVIAVIFAVKKDREVLLRSFWHWKKDR